MIHEFGRQTRAVCVLLLLSVFLLSSVGSAIAQPDPEVSLPAADTSQNYVFMFLDPPKLRACCAFGHSLQTKIGSSLVPVQIDNVLHPDRLGLHAYKEQNINTEMNGLIYTCRGGTIDIAHIRDYADWTAYLYFRIRKVLGSSALIPLPPEAASRDILLRPIAAELTESERNELAIVLAQRIAFALSVWHEIVTWYGHASVELFSERVSSFSPEDNYSNLLGAQIGADALRQGGNFDRAVDEQLEKMVFDLAPLLPGQTKKTFNTVDGLWWDRTKQMPDTQMVIRRNVDYGDTIQPWIISDKYSPFCSQRDEPVAEFEVPRVGPQGIDLKSLYELRFRVDRNAVPRFPLPDTDRLWVNENDFPFILARIRREVKKEFGPYGDQSGMDIEELGVVPNISHEYDPEYPCGRHDPDCSVTGRDQTHGVKIGLLRFGGGNNPGPLIGATLAHILTPGGGFSVFDINTAVNYDRGGYILHVRSIATDGALMFCAEEREDGSGRAEIDWPFVNPFSPKCLGGAIFGIDFNVLELVTEEKADKISLRPIEFGVVLNILANGYNADFLERSFLISVGMAPEWISDEDYDDAPVRAYTRIVLNTLHDDCKWGVKVFGQFRDDVSDYKDYSTEVGGKITYNILWTRPDLRNKEAIHTLLSLILEGGVEYWSRPENNMPGMLRFYIPPDPDYNSAKRSDSKFTGKVMLYLETKIPTLGLF